MHDRMLDTAVAVVRDEGLAAATTRRLAAESGESLASVHEVLGGRAGLVRDLAGRGFLRLAEVHRAVPRTDDARDDLLALAGAFRRFAREEPHLFAVMFERPLPDLTPGRDELRAGAEIRADVEDRVASLLGRESLDPIVTDAALALVAMSRGLAAQELAGILSSSEAGAERRWGLAVGALIDGLVVTTTTRQHEE